MRMRTATAALCALGAIVAATVSTGAPATAGSSTDLRVGTFNIVTVSADPGASGDRHVWKERRGTVIGQILGPVSYTHLTLPTILLSSTSRATKGNQ